MGDHTPREGSAGRPPHGKGKGVVRNDTEPNPPSPQDNGDNSVVSRIGRSAADLARSVTQSRPNARDLSSLAPSEKNGASSSEATSSTTFGESSSAAHPSVAPGANTFRSGHADAHVAAEEAAFSDFLDSKNVFVPTEPLGLENSWHAAAHSTTRTMDGRRMVRGASSIAVQQQQDGAEVVHLLSQPDADMPAYDGDVTVSPKQLDDLARALFGESSTAQLSASDWNNVLNFVPGFLRTADIDTQQAGLSEDMISNLGVTGQAEAGQLWLEQWNRVLTSYNDEVWGDLGSLVKEARDEVKQMARAKEDAVPPDAKSLQRLRLILGRFRAKL